MPLAETAEDRAFAHDVEGWLRANLPDDIRERWLNGSALFTVPEDAIRWQRILHSQGWAAPHWPKEYGGRVGALRGNISSR